MLTPEEKIAIREAIHLKLAELNQSIPNLRIQSQPVSPDNAIGRITRMDAMQQQSISEASLRAAEQLKIRLEESLSTIDQPDFGICVGCRGPIPAGRLLVMPESRACVNCLSQRSKRG